MKKLILFILVAFTFLSACQLQKVTVNLYTPSKLIFPPEVRSVLVTSRYVPATGPYEDVQWGAFESVDSLKWLLSESVADTLAKRMASENKYLVKVRHLPRMLRNNDANLPDPLPWSGLSELAKKEFVQTILIIEGFDLKKTPVEVNLNEGNYRAHFTIGITLALRIYEPEKMRMIDDSVYTFTNEFTGTGKTGQEALNRLPDDKKAFFIACSQAAGSYYALIRPGEASAKRFYYTKGDSSLIKADLAVKDGKWGRAESKWKWLAYNAQDSAILAKASYNMALACERDGRINQALGYARRSQRIKQDNFTLKYINVLNKKRSDFDDLTKQKKIIKRW